MGRITGERFGCDGDCRCFAERLDEELIQNGIYLTGLKASHARASDLPSCLILSYLLSSRCYCFVQHLSRLMTLGLNDPEAPSCDRRWQTKPLIYNVQHSHTAPSVPFSLESYIPVLVERNGQTLAPSILDGFRRESEVSACMIIQI